MADAEHPLVRRKSKENIWFARDVKGIDKYLSAWPAHELTPEVLPTEQAVGAAMLAELDKLAETREGDLVIILLGGRGAQAMHQLLGERARKGSGHSPTGLAGKGPTLKTADWEVECEAQVRVRESELAPSGEIFKAGRRFARAR